MWSSGSLRGAGSICSDFAGAAAFLLGAFALDLLGGLGGLVGSMGCSFGDGEVCSNASSGHGHGGGRLG